MKKIQSTCNFCAVDCNLDIYSRCILHEYLTEHGKESLGFACSQLAGLQIWVTSMLVGFVVLMLLRMLLKKDYRA